MLFSNFEFSHTLMQIQTQTKTHIHKKRNWWIPRKYVKRKGERENSINVHLGDAANNVIENIETFHIISRKKN